VRLVGKPELTSPGSRQATHLYLANLAATTQQKDDEENGNGNTEQPEQDVTRGRSLFYSVSQFHDEILASK
jgi:hypothetical protein